MQWCTDELVRWRMHSILTVLVRGARLRCPCCGHGSLFRSAFALHDACTACDERFEREPGLSLGSIYINLILTMSFSLAGVTLTSWLTDLTLTQELTIWAGGAAIISVLLYRLAKGLWIGLVFLGDGVYLEWPAP